jgi:hypothetical protein
MNTVNMYAEGYRYINAYIRFLKTLTSTVLKAYKRQTIQFSGVYTCFWKFLTAALQIIGILNPICYTEKYATCFVGKVTQADKKMKKRMRVNA